MVRVKPSPAKPRDRADAATPEALLAQAVALHRAGRLAEAESLYRRVLARQPGNVAVRANLGAALRGQGRSEAAIACYRNALMIDPATASVHYNLGNALRAAGRREEATARLRAAARVQPDNPEAHNNLGLALRDAGDGEGAAGAFRRALAVRPDHPEALNNLGLALGDVGPSDGRGPAAFARAVRLCPDRHDLRCNFGVALREDGRPADSAGTLRVAVALHPDLAGGWYSLANALREMDRPAAAETPYRRALRLEPDHADARNNLGLALTGLERPAEAEAVLRRAIALRPDYAEAYNNLGAPLKEREDPAAAAAAFRRAIALRPGFPEGCINLGVALKALGDIDGAMDCYRRAIGADGGPPYAHFNMGNACQARGDLEGAIASFRRAAQLDGDYVDAHWNLSLALLARGDFAQGWPMYEWRWRNKGTPPRGFPQPQWTGGDIRGRTILLHAEQGLGDTLHFVRYAPLVAARGARVVLEVQAPLVRLLAPLRAQGVAAILAKGDPLPDFDVHCPLLSLPLAFGTRLDSVPASIPYLHPPDAEVETWRHRLAQDGAGALRVGLVWAGNPRKDVPGANAVDRLRSITLGQLAPLAGTPGVRFYSLQKGDEAAAQAKAPPPGLDLVDRMDAVGDFADTAALISHLDLVVGVDTSVVHLAGGMGKPVWVLSRFDGCWRWLSGRDDSPWYPTLRLYRQEAPSDWTPVIARLAADLRAWASTRTA
ncbi:tetratricopeptide repeat protein [Azospirillum halopraeferens]|uniref:tetratricopeptide repeat protein n=1 Tax=Azospirillum halopraeferens TaxID=34010 RepID=UPI000424E330|nr:tetratricopeptide repeat protein [Azospirillum halopraeferens]